MSNRKRSSQSEIEDDHEYLPPDQVEPSRIYHMFFECPLFDDVFLGMQAMNIDLTDQSLVVWEFDLLREYQETERTPTASAMMVSAWSQMWIFALYELLRTWRQRIDELVELQRKGKLRQYTDDLPRGTNAAASMRRRQALRLRREPQYKQVLLDSKTKLEDVFRMTEALRINLAKHEIPKGKGTFPHAPGYGRINRLCGALDFEVHGRGNSWTSINRRDIADALRRIWYTDHPKQATK